MLLASTNHVLPPVTALGAYLLVATENFKDTQSGDGADAQSNSLTAPEDFDAVNVALVAREFRVQNLLNPRHTVYTWPIA